MSKAFVFKRDHINTDEIIPARYLNTDNEAELAKHCMEDLDKDFVKKVKPGDCIVAGEDFGCGSSREHAVWAIRVQKSRPSSQNRSLVYFIAMPSIAAFTLSNQPMHRTKSITVMRLKSTLKKA